MGMTILQQQLAAAGVPQANYNQHEASVFLRLSERTLERLRGRGGGPKYSRLGRRVVYRRADLDAWVASRSFDNTTQEFAR
jgi:predicted DNA-binding transcriptional regulator AlpA